MPMDDSLGCIEEYRDLKWLDPDEIIDSEPGQYHPALIDMVNNTLERITQLDPTESLQEEHLPAVDHIATVEAALCNKSEL
jgi:hypothetical protein